MSYGWSSAQPWRSQKFSSWRMSCWKVGTARILTARASQTRDDYGGGQQEKRKADYGPVAPAHVGRRAGVALRGDLEAAFRVRRKPREDLAVAVDRRGDPGVGRGEMHEPGLDRPH